MSQLLGKPRACIDSVGTGKLLKVFNNKVIKSMLYRTEMY